MRGILTYHSIDPSGSPISVDPGVFQEHLRVLARGALEVVDLEALVQRPPEANAVALTFDDGFVNFATHAAPLLEQYQMPATLFVVSGHVGRTNAWGGVTAPNIPSLPLLDWTSLGRLAENGVALGAHSRSHPRLPELDSEALLEELAGCQEQIRRETGRTANAFAYPYGAVDRRTAQATMRVYDLACTTELRPFRHTEDPAWLPRIDMYYLRDGRRLEGWASARFRQHLWFRRQGRRVRSLLRPGRRQ